MSSAIHRSVARDFNETIETLWQGRVKFDHVLLLVTSAAPCMKTRAKGLGLNVNVTCAAHALHGVCGTVRALYPNVDKLVANGKKIVVKPPAGINLCKSSGPDTPFSATPVITVGEPGWVPLRVMLRSFKS
jgi:hypothetical protein